MPLVEGTKEKMQVKEMWKQLRELGCTPGLMQKPLKKHLNNMLIILSFISFNWVAEQPTRLDSILKDVWQRFQTYFGMIPSLIWHHIVVNLVYISPSLLKHLMLTARVLGANYIIHQKANECAFILSNYVGIRGQETVA